jgi:hypothetical protein
MSYVQSLLSVLACSMYFTNLILLALLNLSTFWFLVSFLGLESDMDCLSDVSLLSLHISLTTRCLTKLQVDADRDYTPHIMQTVTV